MPWWDYYMIYVMLIPSAILLVLIILFTVETPHFYLFMAKDIAKFNQVIDYLSNLNQSDQETINEVKELAD
jgi:predicted PurR-regulated permease PerM